MRYFTCFNTCRATWTLAVVSLLIGHCAGAAPAIQLKGGESPQEIQEVYTKALAGLLPGLGANKENDVRNYESILHNAARPEAEPERLACCKAVAEALTANTTPADAKIWMMKLVTFAGRAEVVPALSNILNSKDLIQREYARCALQQNPSLEAAAALRASVLEVWKEKKDPLWQAALALAQGGRKDANAFDGFSAFVSQPDESVVESALVGLGALASVQDIGPRPGIWKSAPQKLQGLAAESYMKNAERLMSEGKASQAGEIYSELYKPDSPRGVRLASLHGLLQSQGDAAGIKILNILGGTDADARAIALGFIPDMGAAGLKVLAGGLAKLPVESQALVLSTLAERGEKSALPTALEFAKSKDEQLRQAGLAALGGLGDASTVSVLVEALPASRESLVRLSGPQVEEKILGAMQAQTNNALRAALIEVIENRSIAAAVPLLLQECLSDSSTVRRPAMHALGKLAQAGDVPAMIKGLLKTSPGRDREEAEKAIASVCERSAAPAQQADKVLALYQEAGATDRQALLPVLGRIGGKKVFEVIKSALASPDTSTAQAALDAMANWPDSDDAVETELLNVARTGGKTTDRAAAVRAYIRLISTPSGLPEMVRLEKFQKAMELAQSDQDKNMVLEKIAEIKRIEVLRFVKPYLDKPALAQKASNATLDLARDRALRGKNKAEFDEALQKVIAVCKDQGLIERATRYSKE